MAGVEWSSGISIPSEVSALLLTVVILGVLVAAVVADLVGGPEQPATTSPRHHRDYEGPWKSWLHTLQGLFTQIVQRIGRGLEVIGTAIEKGARAALAAGQSGVTALRESREGITARRRALKERHEAHARHIEHVDEITEPADQPEPYPLPPPLSELEEHERRLRAQAEIEMLPRRAVRLPDADAPPPPPPPPAGAPGIGPGATPAGPGAVPGGAGAVPAGPGPGGGTALRERPVGTRPLPRNRRSRPQPRPHKAHLPAPPRATRVRSALILVVMMSALGAVVTALFLGVLFLIVQALSGV